MKTIAGIVLSGVFLWMLWRAVRVRAQENEEDASVSGAPDDSEDSSDLGNPDASHDASDPNALCAAMKKLGEEAQAVCARRPASGRLLALRVLRRLRTLGRAQKQSAPDAAAQLLLDNAQLIQISARTLARSRSVALPACATDIRIELFAAKLLHLCGNRLDEETLRTALHAFDDARALSLAELDALPDAFLRVILRRMFDTLRPSKRRDKAEYADPETITRLLDDLRTLQRLPFAVITQECSSVCAMLSLDPAGVYPRMDDASRRLYREAAARIAHSVALNDSTIVREALSLCQDQSAPGNHVGLYLLSDGVDALYARLGGMPARIRVRRFASAHAGSFFLAARVLLSVLLGLLFSLLGVSLVLLPLCALVASEASLALITRFVRAAFPPRPLPVLHFEAIPESARTLVVVPTLLSGRESAVHMLEHLAVLARAGGDEQLDYLLLGDFRDSDAAQEVDDADIIACIREGIAQLNQTQGAHFYYLHRKRVWDESHRRHMGAMRKRGALLCLCELIEQGKTAAPLSEITFDPVFFHHRYRYMLTLDSDTLLPPGCVHTLVGAMEHPLCRASILSPRMESAARMLGTHLADMLGGPGGMELYQGGAGELYQTLCGRGSFAGKGLLRVHDYFEKTRDLPGRYALSHDLLEGELCGSALMENAALYDGPCTRTTPFFMQLDRWTRGDWQLFPWLFPRVPFDEKHWIKNPLSLLSRVKIYDNLRRSLVAPAQLALLFITAIAGNGPACLLALFLPHLDALLPPSRRALLFAYVRIALLPRFSLLSLRAAGRALYRQYISGAHLLEWIPAADAQKTAQAAKGDALQGWCGAALLLLSIPEVHALYVAVWISLSFFLAPRLYRYLNAPIYEKRPLDESERAALMRYARSTWAFFERTVTEESRFLPPDNLQIDPPLPAAARTSPTNIGMYLLACVSAQQLGLITPDELLTRLSHTLQTLESLPKWRGHLYNWYDTRTGEIAPPAYVSSVDSGNFLACLIACAQSLRTLSALGPDGPALADAFDALLSKTDIAALYDARSDLFYVGAQLDAQENVTFPDTHYALLASESRLLSYVAVALRAVPLRHWHRLSRSLTHTRYGDALCSWSGTMFEYLMPRLLQRDAAGTLLSVSCHNAALVQMTLPYVSPWGISESGRFRLDEAGNYQYHAFGVPALALRATHFQRVITPYAGALALSCFPHAAVRNLAHMEALGWLGELGFFEAADYTAPDDSHAFFIVKSHMAHHQGMTLCAICNALTGNALVNLFHSDARMEAFSLLLEERI